MRGSLLPRGALHLAIPLLLACPAGFVDPHPPALEVVEKDVQLPPRDAPTVYAVLFDVHLANGGDCTWLQQRVSDSARWIFLPSGRPGAELPMQDLTSGTCHQQPDRTVNGYALVDQLAPAQAQWGTGNVRLILLYLNNVDLEVPPSVRSSVAQLQQSLALKGAPSAVVLGLISAAARNDPMFDRTAAWTYAQDPSLFSGLSSVAGTELPLELSGLTPDGGFPLFTPDQLSRFRQYKGCSSDGRVTGIGFSFDGRTHPPGTPGPHFLVLPAVPNPVLRTRFLDLPSHVAAEGCTANCDRYLRSREGKLERWDVTNHCFAAFPDGGSP